MTSRLSVVSNEVVLDFPYDKQQVIEVKKIPRARWNSLKKLWIAPISSLPEAITFARKWSFQIDSELSTIELPDGPKSQLELIDSQVLIHVPYDRVAIAAVKQIPGIVRDPDKKAWVAPRSSLAPAITFADDFKLNVDEEARRLSRIDDDGSLAMIDLSSAKSAEFPVGSIPLRPHQQAAVKYVEKAKRSFICDDMGLGKSITAIAAIEHLGAYPALVVCPPSLILNWLAEYEKWLPERNVQVVRNRKGLPEEAEVLVIGNSNLDHYKDELLGFAGYVFDESHAFKNFQAKRTKAAIKMAKKSNVVICLTGTPITNRPAEFAPQLQILGRLEEFGGKIGYWRYYCAGFKDQWGRWNVSGAKHLDELNDKLRASCMVRRRKEDVLEDLPPVLHNRIILDVQLREYKKAESDIIKYVVNRAIEIAEELGVSPTAAAVRARMAAQAQEQLVRISVLRRLAALAKMDSVIESINELREEGRKVVVAAHHRDVVQTIANHFDGLRIQGGMKTEDVEEHKRRFQEDPDTGVIAISMEAAKMGHTLTAASDVIFVELPWTPADVDQTYSRCHRIGQKGTVTAHYLLAANTIDEMIFKIIESKRAVVDAATDGGEILSEAGVAQQILSEFLAMGTA